MNNIKISKKLISDIVDFEYNSHLKYKVFNSSNVSKKGLALHYKGYIHAALKSGMFDYKYTGKKISAYFIFTQMKMAKNLPLGIGVLNSSKSAKSKQWIIDKTKECSFFLNESSLLQIPIHLKNFLPELNKIGLNIDTVQQIGNPKDCLNKLSKTKKVHNKFEDHGLSLQLATSKDLLEIKKIEKAEFKRNPQFGWFVSQEGWLDKVYNNRKHSLNKKNSSAYIIKTKRNKIKGYFGTTTEPHPVYGKLAGPEFVFDKSIQKKGLSTPAYLILLQDMINQKANILMGNTSQIGVFKNAKAMGRVPVNIALRYSQRHFKKNYFQKYI